jgi:protein-tyrosine phosphatase
MLRTVSLPEKFTRGTIYLSSMPGRFELLRVFLDEVQESNVSHIACLVSDEEIGEKSPDYLVAMQSNEVPARIWRFEISDYGIPEDVAGLDRMLDLIRERLDENESVVIHCAAGHGRTGIVSILLLARMGMPLEDAVAAIGRAGSAPDMPAQWEFLKSRAAAWQGNHPCD